MLSDIGSLLLPNVEEKRQNSLETSVRLVVIPALNKNAVFGLVLEVLLDVVDYYGLAQIPPDLLQILHIDSSAQEGVLSVESVTHHSMRVYLVDDPICVVLLSRREDNQLEVFREFHQKLLRERSHIELLRFGALVVMDESFIQIEDQSIFLVRGVHQEGNA